MKFIISGIIVIIVIIIIALVLRKRLYGQIDYYENWKLNIMNRNVANELARVKELTLEGDTKDRFENWKNEWEMILNDDMADVEELLYDTERAADRYNFPGANKCMNRIHDILIRVEGKIEQILEQLHELLDIEETNRQDMAQIAPKLDALKKHLSSTRNQYHQAEARFEVEIDEIREQLKVYDDLAEEGNYAEGAAIVKTLKDRTHNLEKEIEEFPRLYKACQQELPHELDELTRGIAEMKDDGYHVEHLHLNSEIGEYQGQLLDFVNELEQKGTGKVKEMLPEMENRIQEMYDLLEQEALAKNYVESKIPYFEQALHDFSETFSDTKSQVEQLRETYHFEDADLEKYMSLEKRLTQMTDQLSTLLEKSSENQAHTSVREDLEDLFEHLETLEAEHKDFRESIHTLRKDELEAHEQLEKMHDDMFQMRRKLKNSNLPGVPDSIWKVLDEASSKNEQVLDALDKQPLDILEVNQALEEARDTVNKAVEQTNTIQEQAYLTELVIQYANRYRSSYPILHGKLIEAENQFRNAEYELSLEQAANALEEIEPGALKKVEQYRELTVS